MISSNRTGGRSDFATLTYAWMNEQGKPVLAGVIDSPGDPLNLSKGEGATLILPIELPRSAGKYLLKVSFDNKRLESTARDQSDVTLNLNSVFFNASNATEVRID